MKVNCDFKNETPEWRTIMAGLSLLQTGQGWGPSTLLFEK